jgi:hypothetical protein
MSETRSYRPGDWFGIFGDEATVVLPPSEKARVAGLWALVDAGAGFDEVLDALIADGLRDERVGGVADDHVEEFLVGNGKPEPVHLLLPELVLDQCVEHLVADLVDALWRHRVAGSVLLVVDLGVDGAHVGVIGDGFTVDLAHRRAHRADDVEPPGVLQNPDDAEGEYEKPKDCSGILPEFIHHTHR